MIREKPHKAFDEAKKNKFIIVALMVLFIYLIIIMVAALLIDARHVCFYINGEREQSIEFGESYEDLGAYAVTTGKLFGDSRPLPLTQLGEVDSGALGSYTIEYKTKWLFNEYSTERIVHVKDTRAPVIELKHIDGYTPSWLTGYEEEGFSAYDEHDGDLTASVSRSEQEGKIVYTVSDSSGNTASIERSLTQLMPPSISLKGEGQLVLNATQYYNDAGFTALDAMGNDISELVEVQSNVTPYTAGDYSVIYTITNSHGDTVTAVRHIKILANSGTATVTPDKPTIYLTFDDGPGPYTSRLLDVLARYNVKVTFFVTAANYKYYDQIGRAFREGHSIGVHTYSHDYNTIYSSEAAFFEDFNAMQEIIYEQTGAYTTLYRFPGGSSNTVSRFNPGIISRLTAALNDMGITYFDWNVSSGDAGETTETKKVVKNIESGCAGMKTAVVLQHDIKSFSVDAVEDVILWGLSNGYSFAALTASSPTAHHGVNN